MDPMPAGGQYQSLVAEDLLVGEHVEPTAGGLVAGGVGVVHVGTADDRACAAGIATRQPMPHRLLERVMLLEPGRRAAVQGGGVVLVHAEELGLQELGEEVVVAEPFVGVVEGTDEEVVTGDGAQHIARLLVAGHRAAEAGERRSRIEF